MSQDGMQEKRQSRRRNLDRSANDSDISRHSKDQLVLCLCLWHLFFAHLATTTTICTWRGCEDMSQDVCKKKGKVEETLTDLKMSLIKGKPKDQIVLCLCLWHFPLHTWRQLRPYAHGGTAKTCRKMACKKKGKVEEETFTDLQMILTSQDNQKTRWFFAFAFGIFRCTPGDNYDHMHMEGLRRHVARCMQEKRQSRRRNLDRSEDESDIKGKPKDQIVLCLCLWHFPLHTWRQLRPYAHGGAAKTCRKMYARKKAK